MDPIVGAGLAVGGNLVGSLISGGVNKKAAYTMQRREQEFNRAQAEWQNQVNIANWQMQNNYNSPANQMKRLQEAGLNPNLIYGNGSTSTGNATSMPEAAKVNPAHQSAPEFNFADFGMADAARVYMQMQSMGAELEKTHAQTDYYRALETKAINDGNNSLLKYQNDSALREDILLAYRLGNKKRLAELGLIGAQTRSTNQGTLESVSRIGLNESNAALNAARAADIQQRLQLLPAQAALLNMQINEAAARITQTIENTKGVRLNNEYLRLTQDERVQQAAQVLQNCIIRNRNGQLDFNMNKFKFEMDASYGTESTGQFAPVLNMLRTVLHQTVGRIPGIEARYVDGYSNQ